MFIDDASLPSLGLGIAVSRIYACLYATSTRMRFKRYELLAFLNYTPQTPRRDAEPSHFSASS